MAAEPGTRSAAEATTGASVLRGSAWNIASRIVPQLYVLVVSVAAARYLGVRDFGRQSFIAFAEISVIMLVSAGLPLALTRYVADAVGRDDRSAAGGLVAWAWRVEAGAAGLGAVVLVAVGLAGAEPKAAWLLAATAAGMLTLQRVPSSLLIGFQRWREASFVGLITGAAGTVATITVLALGQGITGMFAVEAAVAAANLVWIGALARRADVAVGTASSADRVLLGSMLRYAALASVSVVTTFVVWRRSEFFFLKQFSSDEQIAFYSVAFAASAALILLPQAVVGVFFPAVATLFGAGASDRIQRGFGRGLRLLLVVSFPITALVLALGPATLKLVYGSDFDKAGTVLLILAAPFPIISLVSLSQNLLSGIGLLRFPLVAGLVAAAANIGLDLLLIPGHGAVGGAIASTTAQLVVGVPVVAYACASVGGGIRWASGRLLRAALAAAVSGIAAWAVSASLSGVGGVVAGFLVGVTAFGTLAAVLRILSTDDARWLESAVGRRFVVLHPLFRAWSTGR